jgi:hypothetical protein
MSLSCEPAAFGIGETKTPPTQPLQDQTILLPQILDYLQEGPHDASSNRIIGGAFVGVSAQDVATKEQKFPAFLCDFGSVPGSQLINQLEQYLRLSSRYLLAVV